MPGSRGGARSVGVTIVDLGFVFQKLAIALGLGLLVGLQRERVQSQLAGIRTFALITVLGAVSALLASSFGGWIVGLGVLGLAALLVAGNLAQPAVKAIDPGLTTEIAALVTFGVGAYLVVGHTAVAIAIGGAVALLLHWKAPLHAFVARIGESDLTAIMQFVLIALVILPVLPDQTYGPFDVLNPHEIWFMVVLIVGINLSGYVAYKLFGQGAGTLLAGALGGLISSTATTVSYARRTRHTPEAVPTAALVIVIASAVAMGRVLGEIAAVASGVFWQLALPLAVMLGGMAVLAAGMYFLRRGDTSDLPPQANPAELKPALLFGGLYALAILGVAAAKHHLGETGLYGVALLSGVHDLDAITLSTARLADQGRLDTDTGWRLILAASLSNLFVKGCIAGLLGHRGLLREISLVFGAALVGGLLLLFLWPAGW
jgi:uncharacterized membrane protein (DUF4010 family)